jgi:hypothetical protein
MLVGINNSLKYGERKKNKKSSKCLDALQKADLTLSRFNSFA